jgi:hypothetical protein
LGGTLAVANGGTGQSTLAINKVMVGNGTSGVLTPTNLHWDNTNSRLGIGTASPLSKFDVSIGNQTSLGLFSASGHTITSSGGSIGNLYQISFGYGSGASYGSSAIAGLTESSAGYNTGALVFATRNQTTDVAPTERMRIT